MTITTLLAYWTDQEIEANNELSDARVALSTAQNELAIQSKKLTKANQELADLAAQAKNIRNKLSEATTSADVHALESELAKVISDVRAKRAEIIEIEAHIDSAQTELDLANARINATTLRISTVAKALEMDDQDKDRIKIGDKQAVRTSSFVKISNLNGHPFTVNDAITVMGMTDNSFNGTFTISAVTDTSITYPQAQADAVSGNGVVFGNRAQRLRHRLTEPPLSTIVADAAAALATKPWTDAKARIEADFPQELRDCANERAAVELKRLGNDQKKASEIDKMLNSVIDQAVSLREVFKDADASFREYIVNAKRNFDRALAIAASVADPKQNPLTAAENASIHDDALKDKRNKAAEARKAIATAQIDVDSKQADVELAELKATAAGNDPQNDPDVKTAKDALKAAQDELDNKKNAFTSDMQTDLNDWETAVPDTAWRNLADFQEAKRLLLELKEKKPADLEKVMDDAEKALVTSLQEADKNRKKLDLLRNEAKKTASKASFDTGILPRRLLAALRGDS